MKHTVEKTAAGLRIAATVAEAQQQAKLLEALNQCAAGTCSCPSPQYDKLETIAVQTGPGTVAVDLTAKAGEAVDVAEIERCLEHTAQHLGLNAAG